MELNELEECGIYSVEITEINLPFSADGMIHAVQPMSLFYRRKARDIHHSDTGDDPSVCLTCPYEDCSGSAKCYRKRKKSLEDKKKCPEEH